MLIRWFFSETYTDPELHHVFPACRAYGHHWHLPRCPETPDGSALVQMACGQHQIEAAKQDPRVLVLPPLSDRSPLPAVVLAAYPVPSESILFGQSPLFNPWKHRLRRVPLLKKIIPPSVPVAVRGMCLADLLAKLAESEPRFAHEMRIT